MREPKEKPDKCKIKIAGNKSTMMGNHKWVPSLSPGFQVCSTCGAGRKVNQ